ncbi:hypothetical protein D3C80_1481240 [compost metagenome]
MQQCFDVGFGQGFRQRPAQLRHLHLQGGVDRHQLFAQQVAKEATQAREKACGGTRFVALVEAPGQVIEDQLATGVGQGHGVVLEPAVEQRQVAAIGDPGVVRQAFFQPQGIKKLLDQGVV